MIKNISHGTMHEYFLQYTDSRSFLEATHTHIHTNVDNDNDDETTDDWQSDNEGEFILFLILFL